MSHLKLQEKEIEDVVHEAEFLLQMGSGRLMKSLTAEGPSGNKPDPCDPPTALAS
jgi:hypothetical protein